MFVRRFLPCVLPCVLLSVGDRAFSPGPRVSLGSERGFVGHPKGRGNSHMGPPRRNGSKRRRWHGAPAGR